jgi:hypothetical protein
MVADHDQEILTIAATVVTVPVVLTGFEKAERVDGDTRSLDVANCCRMYAR